MIELPKLLEDSGIQKAVVIDDAFDILPRPGEIGDREWSIFFDDLGEAGHKLLADIYPGYEDASPDDLKVSQEFIELVWENRAKLPQAACDPLFHEYENTKATERTRLDRLIAELKALGLTCTKMGCKLDESAKEAELLFVDLFLGFRQGNDDMDDAIQLVEKLVSDRKQDPPLVVLMSRSPRLEEKRNEFRDEAGLLGSFFRVFSKADLAKEGTLENILTRLATHYEDAKRVAGFVHAWDSGLDQARKSFIQILRRLDLPDLAQIQALLLDVEGQDLGEYLLDAADRVLQHEIEGSNNTISAALELNKINLERYPAPHLIGSSDLQELVHRMVFLHPDRLRLSEADSKPQLQFGDVLRWTKEDGTELSDDVSLVVTPACDLVRNRIQRVMLLSGKLESLEPKDWSYQASPVRTAIVILPNEERKWIKWDLKDIKTLGWYELDDLIGQQQKLKRIGRLREIYTIEIQQKLLADFGRIGRPANLPVSFPVAVSLFYVDTARKAQKLHVEQIEYAVCYVGRGKSPKPVHRLVLTEQACDHIEQALQALEDSNVHNSAKASLAAVKKDRGFFTQFERGEIEIAPERGRKFFPDNNTGYIAIVRGEDLDVGSNVNGNLRKAALIVKVTDIPEEDTN